MAYMDGLTGRSQEDLRHAFGANLVELEAADAALYAANSFQAQDWGTPQQILDRIDKRRGVLGEIDTSIATSYGGMPYAHVAKSMRLFSQKVLPELKRWNVIAAESSGLAMTAATAS